MTYSAGRPKSPSGFSLVKVLVVLGILAVVMVLMISSTMLANKEMTWLANKAAVLDLEKTLVSVVPGVDLCKFEFDQAPADFTLPNANFTLSPGSFTVSVPSLTIKPDGSDPLARVNERLNTGGADVKVKTITLSDLTPSGTNHIGTLTINFETEIRQLQPIRTKATISSTVTGNNRVLTGCNTVPRTSGGGSLPKNQVDCEAMGGTWVVPPAPRPAFCDLDGDSLDWY